MPGRVKIPQSGSRMVVSRKAEVGGLIGIEFWVRKIERSGDGWLDAGDGCAITYVCFT